jgi:tetratricopeptide (TPR) repeat protein
LQDSIEQFGRDRDVLLFHNLSVAASEEKANREAICKRAPAALQRFGLGLGQSTGGTASAFDPFLPFFRSAQQRRQVVEWCCEVLLVWAEAEAGSSAAQSAQPKAALQRALRLVDHAAALGRAHGLQEAKSLHQRRAVYLAAQGDRAAAELERVRAGRLRPATALDHFLLALESYHRGELRRAVDLCEAVLRLQPVSFWPQYVQALCYLRLEKWDRADELLTACLRQPQGRDFLWALVQRATARIALKNLPGAEADLTQAQRQARGGMAAHVVQMGWGQLALEREDWEAARKHFREAIKQQPGVYQAHANLAHVYRKLKDPDRALAAMNRAIELQPGVAQLYYARAEQYLERDKRAEARRDLEQAIARGKSQARSASEGSAARGKQWLASAHVKLSYLKHQAGEYAAALKDQDAALKVVKNYPPAYLLRGQTLLEQGRHAEAGRAVDDYLAATSKPSSTVYKVRGLIHAAQGDYSRAVEAYTQALLPGRDRDPDTLCYRGWARLQLGERSSALADFEEVLKKHPRHSDALCGRGQVRIVLGQVDRAIEDAEAALEHGEPTKTLLCSTAGIYARAALHLDRANQTGTRARLAANRTRARRYEAQAADLIERALRKERDVKERQRLWRDKVQRDAALRAVLPTARMAPLLRDESPR